MFSLAACASDAPDVQLQFQLTDLVVGAQRVSDETGAEDTSSENRKGKHDAFTASDFGFY